MPFLFFCALFSFSTSIFRTAFAESPLYETVVVSDRLPEEGVSKIVITRDEIEKSHALSLVPLLNQKAGVELISASTGVQTLSIRGGASWHTLVIVDGVMVNDPTDPN